MMPSYAGDPKAQDPAKFAEGMTGECLCGNIKLTLTRKELFTRRNGHLCHCMNCRKSSGCVASNNMVVDRASVDISDPKGFLKTYHDSNTGSGLTARRSFCSICGRCVASRQRCKLSKLMIGSNIYSIPTDSEEHYVLPLGIFPLIPEPEFELFADHKHAWEPVLQGTKQYKFMTSSGEFEQ